MRSITDIIEREPRLPTLPVIAIEILDAVREDSSSFTSLAKVVSSDPGIAAKVLKVANSSFYGLSKKVSTIPQALSMLGLNVLKNIALGFVVVDSMKGSNHGSFDFDLFWRRAVTAGVAAESVSRLIGSQSDESFVSGLLQDIGIVVMHFSFGSYGEYVLDEKKITGLPMHVVEQNVFGFDHQELGMRLFEKWGFPESVIIPVQFHHHHHDAPEAYQTAATILHLGDRISSIYHGRNNPEAYRLVCKTLKQSCGVDEESTSRMIDSVAERCNDLFACFDIRAADMKPYSQILEEANAELLKLNLSYAQLAAQYQQEKERAEKLACSLKEANEKLKTIAFRDGLTGVYNKSQFFTALEYEFDRGVRYSRPFSLLIIDIDHFKQLNDLYGHRTGDFVLQKVAATLTESLRSTDVVARYGGDEFSVILPETSLGAATQLAERLRMAMEHTPVIVDRNHIVVTISIGVSEYVPGGTANSNTQLFDTADQALYQSKNAGRNQVTAIDSSSPVESSAWIHPRADAPEETTKT